MHCGFYINGTKKVFVEVGTWRNNHRPFMNSRDHSISFNLSAEREKANKFDLVVFAAKGCAEDS